MVVFCVCVCWRRDEGLVSLEASEVKIVMGLFQWLLQELRALRKLVEVLHKQIAQLQKEMHDMQHSNREEKAEAAANAQQTLEEHQASARASTKQLEARIAGRGSRHG